MGRKGVIEVGVELWGAPWYLTGTDKQSPCQHVRTRGVFWDGRHHSRKAAFKGQGAASTILISLLAGDGNMSGKDSKIKYCLQHSQQSSEQMWISQSDPQLSHCMVLCSFALLKGFTSNPFLQLYLLFLGNHPPWKNKTLCHEKEWKAISYPLYPPLAKLFMLNSMHSQSIAKLLS